MREGETYLVSIDETARREFEADRREGQWSPLKEFLPEQNDPRFLPTLEELVQIELEWVWRQGHDRLDTPAPASLKLVEGYLEQFPALNEPAILLRLLTQEYFVRQKFGDRPSVASYRIRFPRLFEQPIDIESLWKKHLQRADRSAQRFGAGQTVDRYRLIAPHASGGFGVVWRAEDERLARPVALKHLKESALASAELRQRFVNEARITARLEHPGIVPIHDIGGLEDECPYYTMKFVRGETFSEAIQKLYRQEASRTLDGRSVERLRLISIFLAVARTVQYAHAHGVIHRDLKPQNVLVGDFGEAMLLDWGLAREQKSAEPTGADTVIGSQLALLTADDAAKTRGGAIMGTPAYMSPEQAAGRIEAVSEQSDIYGLGAMLYEVLTGRAPFAGRSGEEVLDKVRRGDFAPPRSLQPHVERPLEAICLKAMATGPGSRYSRVADLAADVERWLADEPVKAHRETVWQRCSRWSRRHRTWLQAGLALAVLTATVSTVAAVMIDSSRDEAQALAISKSELAATNLQLATTAQDNLELAEERLVQVEAERTRATEHLLIAREAIDKSLSEITQNPELESANFINFRQTLLTAARDLYVKLAEQSPDSPELAYDQAECFLRLGYINHRLGLPEESNTAYQECIRLLEKLLDDSPGDAGIQASLGIAHRMWGAFRLGEHEYQAAEEHLASAQQYLEFATAESAEDYQRELAICHRLRGNLLTATLRPTEASEAYQQARDLLEALPADENTNPDVADAELHQLNQMALGVARSLISQNQNVEVLPLLAESVEQQRQLVERHPTVHVYRDSLIDACGYYGQALYDTNQPELAEASFQEAADNSAVFLNQQPDDVNAQLTASYAQRTLGRFLYSEGRYEEAEPALLESLRIAERLVQFSPNMNSAWAALIVSQIQVVRVYRVLERPEDAAAMDTELTETVRDSAERFATNSAYLRDLATEILNEAEARQNERGVRDVDNFLLQLASEVVQRFSGQESGAAVDRFFLARCYHQIAWMSIRTEHFVEAQGPAEQSLAIFDSLIEEFPSSPDYRHWRSAVMTLLATCAEFGDDWTTAAERYQQAIEAVETEPALAASPAGLSTLTKNWLRLSNLREKEGRHADAAAGYARALDCMQQVEAQAGVTPDLIQDRAECLVGLGRCQFALNELSHAEESYQQAKDLYLRLVQQQPHVAIFHCYIAHLCGTCPIDSIRDAEAAVQYAEQACEMSEWQDYYYVTCLGCAYAESDRFDEAVEMMELAIELIKAAGHDRKLSVYEARLEMFRNHQPYRDLAPEQ